MLKMLLCALAVGCLLASAHAAGAEQKVDKIEFGTVTRELDLTSNLAKEKTTILVENKDTKSISHFLYAVQRQTSDKLAYIGGQATTGSGQAVHLVVVPEKAFVNRPNISVHRINIPSVSPGNSITVVIEVVLAHALQPFPKEISQNERQLIQLIGNAYLPSPYLSRTQSTIVTLPSSTIESFSRVSPTSSSDNVITYGPYSNVAPFSNAKIAVHYENNGPYIVVAELERVIEVSHWGNIAVEEHLHILHEGAKLKGSFSRYDFQRNPQSGPSCVKSYKTILPAAAKDVYYRDEIGNISTSHLREDDEYVELELRPRFPLFGGWQTRYYFGYNLPSYEYLYHSGNKYQLRMRLVDHVFDDQLVEKLTVKIILPEGAKDISFWAPYDAKEQPRQLKFTYLDTIGRPVVVVTAENLVEQHIQDFQVNYTFNTIMLLQEPLLVVAALYLFFLMVIVAVRLDFSITEDASLLAKQKARVLIDSILEAHDRRTALVGSYQTAIATYKTSKDSKTFKTTKKLLDDRYKSSGEEVSSLVKELQGLDSEAIAKVADIQKKMGEVKSLLEDSCSLAEKLVGDKMAKQKYIEQEKSLQSRIDRLLQEVNTIVQTL